MKLIPNGRIWLDTENGAFLGYGRIELLEKIKTTGSLRQAAIEMKMAYPQAHNLIKQMNEKAETPLVTFKKGGKGGGVTEITPEGEKMIHLFKKYNQAFQNFIAELNLES